MNKGIIIIGGYGVFGGRLALALSLYPQIDVVVAGRSHDKCLRFCNASRCEPAMLDVNHAAFADHLLALRPDIVIDAAGPFQNYDANCYVVAEAAIACGAHYLDLSDDAGFTSGIETLDGFARGAGRIVMSGVSTVPALSSAVVRALSDGMLDIHKIESVILPCNRAPRGMSVIRAIVAQTGQPLRVWRDGQYENATGWGDPKRTILISTEHNFTARRWGNLIGAPDLHLFPKHFNARTVLFRAGLELTVLHGGLYLLSWLVRIGLLRTLLPFTPALKWTADRLEPFGSDIGGMIVTVAGRTISGKLEQRSWSLIVREGDGPNVPTIPAQIMCEKLLSDDFEPMACPCLNAFTLVDAEKALMELNVTTSINNNDIALLFETVMGGDFHTLPPQLTDLHTVIEIRRWSGLARIQRGCSVASKIAGWLAGFPPSLDETPVTVTMQRTKQGEVWTRQFGNSIFRSHLSSEKTKEQWRLRERFGMLSFEIGLKRRDNCIEYPILRGRCLGVPLPAFLLPKSVTREYVDREGRACFDVSISLPIAGQVVRYKGWLIPNSEYRQQMDANAL